MRYFSLRVLSLLCGTNHKLSLAFQVPHPYLILYIFLADEALIYVPANAADQIIDFYKKILYVRKWFKFNKLKLKSSILKWTVFSSRLKSKSLITGEEKIDQFIDLNVRGIFK